MDKINYSLGQLTYIISHLGDKYSKEMFGYRLMYSLGKLGGDTGKEWIIKTVKMVNEGRSFINRLAESQNQKKIIFGAGFWGRFLLDWYDDINWFCFADNDIKKKIIDGKKVISFKELEDNYRDSIIVISTRLYHREIYKQLISAGFRENQIINMGKMLDDMWNRQYFDLPNLVCSKNEIFVDAGSLDGTTSLLFSKWCKGKYNAIYSFEPDPYNYKKCEKNLCTQLDRVKIYNCGLWKYHTSLKFNPESSGESCIQDQGSIEIQVNALDEILENKAVTFIKMDIEGSEINALEGAKKIICENKPKIAVSIYHKLEDIWEIPSLLLDYNPNYIFYLRHYSFGQSETVLYAINK